ncbi:MAG: LCP family protein [Acidimicrobiales bacterium]
MSTPGTVVLRRSWPQRLVIVASLLVIAGALAAACWSPTCTSRSRRWGGCISGEVLFTETAPGEPVNFLLIGEDSAARLDPDDPINIGRETNLDGWNQADSITILRVNPTSGQAWVLSLPRDLLVDIPEHGSNKKINSALLVGGPELLVETVSTYFKIPINHYVTLDFLGFQEVVDELDGVPVWFDHPARDPNTGLDISEAGAGCSTGRSRSSTCGRGTTRS